MKDLKSFINESICCTGNCGNSYDISDISHPYLPGTVDSVCRDFNNYFSMCGLNCMKVDDGLYVVTGSLFRRHSLELPVAGYMSLMEWADRVGLCVHTTWPSDDDYDIDDVLSDDAYSLVNKSVNDDDYIILAGNTWHSHGDE